MTDAEVLEDFARYVEDTTLYVGGGPEPTIAEDFGHDVAAVLRRSVVTCGGEQPVAVAPDMRAHRIAEVVVRQWKYPTKIHGTPSLYNIVREVVAEALNAEAPTS